MNRETYKRVNHQVSWMIILANGLGAMLTSFYYTVIAPVPQGAVAGPVVAGHIGGEGRIEYTVIGDTVNLASRLQSLTKELAHDVLMNATAATAHLTLNTATLPGVAVRGKAEPMAVYALSVDNG